MAAANWRMPSQKNVHSRGPHETDSVVALSALVKAGSASIQLARTGNRDDQRPFFRSFLLAITGVFPCGKKSSGYSIEGKLTMLQQQSKREKGKRRTFERPFGITDNAEKV